MLPTSSDEDIERVLQGMSTRDQNLNSVLERLQNPHYPYVGQFAHKMYGGVYHKGSIISGPDDLMEKGKTIKSWKVRFEDGDQEDFNYEEEMKHRDRSGVVHECRGRQFGMLELFSGTLWHLSLPISNTFSGTGVVSASFAQRNWKTMSFDNDPSRNATIMKSIHDITMEDFDFVPDCIWASPPCTTYSNAAGGKHKTRDDFGKTPQAHNADQEFCSMTKIMRWARQLCGHLVIVIENPEAMPCKMPVMAALIGEFGLEMVEVHYCALGRDDKKPTHIWTNLPTLAKMLARYKCCPELCPHHGKLHPVGVRNVKGLDYGSIPVPLAEEVAETVNSYLFLQVKQREKPALLSIDI